MGAAALGCSAGTGDEETEGQSIWDLYDVGEKLGSGNFGEVRACRRRGTLVADDEEDLAVKIVDRQSKTVQAAEAFQTARDELEIMSGIRHPGIVELKAVFEDDRFLYVVMERVGGGELFKAITDRRTTIVEDDIARVGLQVLEALEYLHGVGIVHRDVKAQNILLTEPPQASGRALQQAGVKVIDFGLAARLRQDCILPNESQFDLVCGTPAMCAPEIWAAQENAPRSWKQRWGLQYGPKVDVWACGVVLYMALLGRLPFHEKQASRLAAKVCDPREKPSFETKSYRVSPGCEKFLKSLLEKDQSVRPSASQACRDGWLNGRNSRGVRSRGLHLTPIPQEVREAAYEEAEAALVARFPLLGSLLGDTDSDHNDGSVVGRSASLAELEERSQTIENKRAEAHQADLDRAQARAAPLPSGRGSRTSLESESDGNEESYTTLSELGC